MIKEPSLNSPTFTLYGIYWFLMNKYNRWQVVFQNQDCIWTSNLLEIYYRGPLDKDACLNRSKKVKTDKHFCMRKNKSQLVQFSRKRRIVCVALLLDACKKPLYNPSIILPRKIRSRYNLPMLIGKDPVCLPRYHLPGLIQQIGCNLVTTNGVSNSVFLAHSHLLLLGLRFTFVR